MLKIMLPILRTDSKVYRLFFPSPFFLPFAPVCGFSPVLFSILSTAHSMVFFPGCNLNGLQQLVMELNEREPILDVPLFAYGGVNEERVNEAFMREWVAPVVIQSITCVSCCLQNFFRKFFSHFVCLVFFTLFFLKMGPTDFSQGHFHCKNVQRYNKTRKKMRRLHKKKRFFSCLLFPLRSFLIPLFCSLSPFLYQATTHSLANSRASKRLSLLWLRMRRGWRTTISRGWRQSQQDCCHSRYCALFLSLLLVVYYASLSLSVFLSVLLFWLPAHFIFFFFLNSLNPMTHFTSPHLPDNQRHWTTSCISVRERGVEQVERREETG